MNLERGLGRYRIGGWDFLPATGELRRRSQVRRLEPRAAKVLELLCAAKGGIVSHEQLIDGVWSGRSLSDNSVAVVIGQLRRALDDEAREPRLIETIPKRGYRIAVGAAPRDPGGSRHFLTAALLAMAALGLLAALALHQRSAAPQVSVADVINKTGDPAFDPLARATSELIVTGLSRRGIAVQRGATGRDLQFRSSLVLWSGLPSLGMTATDARGVVIWSGMTNGTADKIPAGVANELDRFATQAKRID
jgi:hypothetical protein